MTFTLTLQAKCCDTKFKTEVTLFPKHRTILVLVQFGGGSYRVLKYKILNENLNPPSHTSSLPDPKNLNCKLPLKNSRKVFCNKVIQAVQPISSGHCSYIVYSGGICIETIANFFVILVALYFKAQNKGYTSRIKCRYHFKSERIRP